MMTGDSLMLENRIPCLIVSRSSHPLFRLIGLIEPSGITTTMGASRLFPEGLWQIGNKIAGIIV